MKIFIGLLLIFGAGENLQSNFMIRQVCNIILISAQAIPKFAEDIDEFDNEFRIKENVSPDEKAKEAAS